MPKKTPSEISEIPPDTLLLLGSMSDEEWRALHGVSKSRHREMRLNNTAPREFWVGPKICRISFEANRAWIQAEEVRALERDRSEPRQFREARQLAREDAAEVIEEVEEEERRPPRRERLS